MPDLWTKGYSQAELDHAQAKFELVFPPDLVALLREKQLIKGYDWRDESSIRKMLEWPFECLLFDVEHNDLWWPEWAERPSQAADRKEVLQAVVSRAPRLIPLSSHRFLPAFPCEPGNPVFSMHGSDTIVYGATLDDYFRREFDRQTKGPLPRAVRSIPFWSELVARNH